MSQRQRDPTPEEIRKACEEIQKEWPAHRKRRQSGNTRPDMAARPTRMLIDLTGALSNDDYD